jgi:hypothetical protein
MTKAKMTTTMIEKNVMVRWEFIVPLEFLIVRLIFPQEGRPAPWNPPLESAALPPLWMELAVVRAPTSRKRRSSGFAGTNQGLPVSI